MAILRMGLRGRVVCESVGSYIESQPDVVPYIDELAKSVDFDKATNQSAGIRLRHIMALTKELPTWIAETRQKYS